MSEWARGKLGSLRKRPCSDTSKYWYYVGLSPRPFPHMDILMFASKAPCRLESIGTGRDMGSKYAVFLV